MTDAVTALDRRTGDGTTTILDRDAVSGDRGTLVVAGDAAVENPLDGPLLAGSLADRVRRADCSLVNLEAPLPTGDPAPKSGPLLPLDGSGPTALAQAGFDAVTLANNHAMDYGETGLSATMSACRDAGLETVGTGGDPDAALEPLVRTVGAAEVAVFAVCEREFGVADQTRPGTAWQNHPSFDDRVADAAERYDAVVVVSHGGIEEVPFPPPGRQTRLREFVDLGADAVVGHHPHVAQGWEVYDDVPVVYSLGNFYFDRQNPATQWGLTVELDFTTAGFAAARVVPVERVDGTVDVLGRDRNPVEYLDHLERLSAVTTDADSLRAHWQEVAERVFLARHGDTLRRTTGATALSLLRSPLAHLRKDGTWDPDSRRAEMLGLLNLTRNESHSELVRTALELRTGKGTDRRTPAVRAETRELLERTAAERLYDRPHPARELAGLVLAKLRRDGRSSLARLRNSLS